MAKFYTPEQWAQLSDEDKKSFFKGLWEGGNPFDLIAPTPQPMVQQAPQFSVAPPPVPVAPAPLVMPEPALGTAQGNMAENASVPSIKPPPAPEEPGTETIKRTTTTSGVPGTAAAVESLRESGEDIKKAQGEISKNRELAALAVGKIRESAATKERAAEEKRLKAESDRMENLAIAEAEVRAAGDEAKAMRVDPNKFYHDRGTLGTILAALSVGAGAYAATMGGGRNYALDIIENAITRDIDAQKSAIEGKRADVAEKRNLFQAMRQRFGDERQAEEAAKINMRQSVIDQLEDTKEAYIAKGIPFANDKELAEIKQRNEAAIFNLVKEGTGKTVTEVTEGKAKKAPAKVSPDQVQKIVDMKSTIEQYNTALQMLDEGKVTAGPVAARASGVIGRVISSDVAGVDPSQQGKIKAILDMAAISKARAMEGGRMTDRDRDFYLANSPQITLPHDTLRKRLEVEIEEAKHKLDSYVKDYEAGGGDLRELGNNATPSAAEARREANKK
jgi:hypothetical protein